MHLERHRNFGHPHLLEMIESIGHSTARERLGVLHVGDLSQPRGGPTPFGHRSHQTGLDVDVWFALDSDLLGRADPLRSNLDAPTLLNSTGSGLNRMLWQDGHARVLEFAARVLRVDRIFVNPHIKRELCRSATGERSWLRKIRPWWGHDDHFHARLSCPPDSPQCESQEALPSGDGCDSSMDWWFRAPTTTPSPGRKAPHRIELSRMPRECQWVLMD
jgi:penicillin-insensitive murein endopeptidase